MYERYTNWLRPSIRIRTRNPIRLNRTTNTGVSLWWWWCALCEQHEMPDNMLLIHIFGCLLSVWTMFSVRSYAHDDRMNILFFALLNSRNVQYHRANSMSISVMKVAILLKLSRNVPALVEMHKYIFFTLNVINCSNAQCVQFSFNRNQIQINVCTFSIPFPIRKR